MKVRLHAIERVSRANGPGLRAVIWFQGCSLGCPGCFNPGTHSEDGGFAADTAEVAASILAYAESGEIEGVSVSGGEPFQQPAALRDLLARCSAAGLGTLVFSGYSLGEIERQPPGPVILRHLDALVAGRYVRSRHTGRGLLGSANQRVHLLSARYRQGDFAAIPVREVVVHGDGSVTASGLSPWVPDEGRDRGQTAKSLSSARRSLGSTRERAVPRRY